MSWRLYAGGFAAFLYNSCLSHVPSRSLRNIYLNLYLGSVGDNTNIQMGCRFANGRKVFLGDRNVINFGCFFDSRHYQILTGNDVSIGPEATLLTLGHDPQSPEFADKGGDIRIGDYTWIGYRAIILPGVTLGEGSVIGAGAVVTKDVDAYAIMAGNPAKKINQRNPNLQYRLNYHPFLL